MQLQLTAKLVQVLPLESGMGRNGEWKKQSIIVETDEQYPKKICVSVWGNKINPSQLQVGNQLTIDFDVESREYNGRWYTDIKAWKIELAGNSPAAPPVANAAPDAAYSNLSETMLPPEPQANFNDLPF